MTPSQEFIFTRTYARWIENEGRRETYSESIDRLVGFFTHKLPEISHAQANAVRSAMLKQDVMPSMRAFWAAGQAAEDNSITLYNCSYLPIQDVEAFSEVLYILMCGTGVGFSVERRNVDKLPALLPSTGMTKIVTVKDSRDGWASALHYALEGLWDGDHVAFDVSAVRPCGARLKTMGGRASGPEPLLNLLAYLNVIFEKRRAKKQLKLTPLNVMDIICKIAEVVVVGGVRRSSLICLFDASDTQVAGAKHGAFYKDKPHRAMSNNSAVFEVPPNQVEFLEHWLTLMKSGSGEPGIFNREAAIKQMLFSGRREAHEDVGTNPCGEISLRPYEFCNLSEVVVRSSDKLDDLKAKVKVATMLGCWQATQVKFPFIRGAWASNCEEERLLGVSLTGISDHSVLSSVSDTAKKWLGELKHVAIREARVWSKKLNTPMSAAITCVKPSGTVSQLVDSASGIHPRYAPFYIRRYRISASDPLFRMLKDQGVPCSPEVGQEPHTADTWVLEFPIAAPKGAKTRNDITALQQLEHWKMLKDFWCEHNPSVTIYVGDNEWIGVGAWCMNHFSDLIGVSFLPRDNHLYRLAPYEEITKEEYESKLKAFPTIDYSRLSAYELEDSTTGAQVVACSAGQCEI